MKKLTFSLLLLCFMSSLLAQQQYRRYVKPTKNVILMVSDGTSIGVISAARWYKIFNGMGNNLAIDPYMCGTVKTFSSNAPIGDSAPTTSCFMTGMQSQTSYVSTYPPTDAGNDLVPVDPARAYQPMATLLEAAKYYQNKATGLVVTCEFPHATPADCSAHYYDRGKYKYIAPQMAYNNLDVMFGGGTSIITDDMKQRLKDTGTRYLENDAKAFRALSGRDKVWALFADKDIPFDLDRDPALYPSLSEMTEKAIERLSQNENGFFLMVEGSKVDWAAHANDAVGCITEYLGFDKAVQAAIDFAKKNGETTVVVLSDHGNSGFTIGNRNLKGYDKATISKLFGNVSKYKKTSAGMEELLKKAQPEQFKSLFKEYTDIDLTDDELKELVSTLNTKVDDYIQAANSPNLGATIRKIMDSRTYFGFTTGGHTGEEVFLAVYHPNGDIPVGMNLNSEINQYMFDAMALPHTLESLSDELFAKHNDVFAGMNYSIDKSTDFPVLVVKKGKSTLKVPAFKSIAYVNNKAVPLKSVTVYIDKNDTFYVPHDLAGLIK